MPPATAHDVRAALVDRGRKFADVAMGAGYMWVTDFVKRDIAQCESTAECPFFKAHYPCVLQSALARRGVVVTAD